MKAAAPRRSRTSLLPTSLCLRLPIAIGAMIAALLAGFLWVTRHQLQGVMQNVGGERAQVAADQISSLLAQGSGRTFGQMRRLAANPAMADFMKHPTPAAAEAVRALVLPVAVSTQSAIRLIDAEGRTLLEIGGAAAARPMPDLFDKPPRSGVTPFRIVDGKVVSATLIEVGALDGAPRPAADTGDRPRPPGFIVVQRATAAAQTSELIARLVGNGANVSLGNQTGDVWTDLARVLPSPPLDRKRRGQGQYRGPDGEWRVGAMSPVTGTPWAVWVDFPRALTLAPANAVVDRMQWITAVFVVGTVLLATVFTRRLTRPLDELTEAAESIAGGQYSGRVSIRRRDEIGRLGRAFNTMVAQVDDAHRGLEARVEDRTRNLERAMTELDQFFSLSKDLLCIADGEGRFKRVNRAWQDALGWSAEELTAAPFEEFVHPDDRAATRQQVARLADGQTTLDFENRYRCRDGSYRWLSWTATPAAADRSVVYAAARDVTEHRQLTATLEQRMGELAEANRELESFSYSVSHDLRAPLRHITGFAAFLDRAIGATLDEQPKRYLQTITEAASRMGRLIDDLLAFSRMARADLVKQPVNLGELVRDVQNELTSGGEAARVAWAVDRLPTVSGDKALLRVVMMNLLSNAVKYSSTRPEPRVEIGVDGHGTGETVVFVRDNGVGFDMQYGHKLFGVFQRLHTTDEFAGTGIGLATVRRVVHRHGGRTWAEGRPDQGATFFFSLPGEGGGQ